MHSSKEYENEINKKISDRWTQELTVCNYVNEEGNPTGGTVRGTGISIDWQDGPLEFDYEKGERKEKPNGAFTQDVILLLIDRLKYYQEGKFSSRENAIAITKLEEVLMWQQKRQDERVKRQVQGQHKA